MPCDFPGCDTADDHHHSTFIAHDGSVRPVVVHQFSGDPRAEVRDPESGEVIFPAIKGPLRVIQGGGA